MNVPLQRTPKQTASRHSDSLPVHRTGVLLSSDDTLCNFALGLSPQILAKSSAVLSIEKHVLWLQIPKDDVPVVQGLQSKKQ